MFIHTPDAREKDYGTVEIRSARPEDHNQVRALWEQCFLVNSTHPTPNLASVPRQEGSDILVAVMDGEILATVMVGHDGFSGWVWHLAVSAWDRRNGLGMALIERAELWLSARGVSHVRLLVNEGNVRAPGLLERLGFHTETVAVWRKSLKQPH